MGDKAQYINEIVKKKRTPEAEEKIKAVQAVVPPDWTTEDILDVLTSTNFDVARAVQDIYEGNAKKNSTPFYYGKKTQKSEEKTNGKESKPYRKPRQDQQGGPRKDKPSGKGPRVPKSKYEKKKDNKDNTTEEAAPNGATNSNAVSETSQPQITENKPVVEEKKPEEQPQHTPSVEITPTPVTNPSPQTNTASTSTGPTSQQPTHTNTKTPGAKKTWKPKSPASTSQSHEQHHTPTEVAHPTPTTADSASSSVVLPPSAKHALQESGPNIRFGGANAPTQSNGSTRSTPKVETHTEPTVQQTSTPKSDNTTVAQSTQASQQQTPLVNNQTQQQQQQVPFMNFGYPPFFQNPYQMNPTATTNSSTTPAPVPFPFAHSYFDMYAMWEMMNQYQMQLQQQQSQQPQTGSTTTPTTTSTQTQSHFPFFPPGGPTPMMNPMMGAFPYYSYADQHGNTQATTQSATPSTTTGTASQQSQQTGTFPQHFQAQSSANTSSTTSSSNRYQLPDYSQTQMDQQTFGQPYLGYDYSSTYYNQQKNYPQNRYP